MACVGAARCEHSCTNEHGMMRHLVNEFQDDLHRPALPYKFKVKVLWYYFEDDSVMEERGEEMESIIDLEF